MRTNSLEIRRAVEAHVLSYYELEDGWEDPNPVNNLKAELLSFNHLPTLYHQARCLAGAGRFLVYYDDINAYLTKLDINPKGKTCSNQQSLELYLHLVSKAIERICK